MLLYVDASHTPAPGSYDSDRCLFGSQSLLEGTAYTYIHYIMYVNVYNIPGWCHLLGGGFITRPGKLSTSTSDATGPILGQHVNAYYCTPLVDKACLTTSKLYTVIKNVPLSDGKGTTTIRGVWHEKQNTPKSSSKTLGPIGKRTKEKVQKTKVQDLRVQLQGKHSAPDK